MDLVTGAAGFMGAHLVNELERSGRKVLAVDDLSGGFRANLNPRVPFLQGSVTDAEFVDGLFEQHPIEHVYHLAAYAAEGLSHFIRRYNYHNNVIGSVNLINNAIKHKVRCFVFTSSIAVYGNGQCPLREDLTPQPEDPYGIAKYTVELDLRAAHEMFGLDHVIFRPHNVYGEYQNLADPYRNVIGIFMKQLLQGQPLTVFGDGSQTRAFTYVGDIIPPLAACVRNPRALNQVFNLGADQPYSVAALAEAVMGALGLRGEIRNLPARNEVLHAYSDHSKAREVFGLDPSAAVGLADGLSRMAAWARQLTIAASEPFTGIEVQDKLPPSWRDFVVQPCPGS